MLDASFLVKLVLEERGSGEVRRLVRSWVRDREVMATIDLALPEALNAIWKHCLKVGDLGWEEAVRSVEDLLKLWSTLKVYSSREIAEEAFKLALEEGITVYGALYVQLAKSAGAGFATFDEKLLRVAAKHA
ncbi:MAG: type II toxin-antitoxin system VapC family toxin [Sulfolobales archaeon]